MRARHAFPLAVTAVLTAALLAGCGDDEPTGADDPASTSAAEPSSPTDSTEPASPTTSDTVATETSDTSAEVTSVPVFFVGDTPQGPRLFSELRDVEADNPPAESLALLMAGDVVDPDYSSLVPADSLEPEASFDGVGDDGTFALTLTDQQWTKRPAGMSGAEARLAVQQLVYTLLSQAGEGEISGKSGSVAFTLDGEQAPYLGVTGPVSAAPELDVRALVNVTSPLEGITVSGSFTASGEASSFEATVPWEVRDSSGAKVLDGFSTAEGWIDHLYAWQTDVDVSKLDPGTYTFVALTDDPSDGEGPGPTEDSKTIVVQ